MKIGIIVAMQKELDLLLPLLNEYNVNTVNDIALYEGRLGNHEVTVMQCGIGKVNAAIGALTLIEAAAPGLVINSGVAGGTGYGAKILDVVVGDRVAYHDVWCGPCGAPRGCVQGLPQYFEAPAGVLASPVFDRDGVKRGLIASGDQFVDSVEGLAAIKEIYPDVMAVDMESAAIAQACYLKKVPFLSIRVISDTPGAADNAAQYATFWDDAPRHTFDVLVSLLETL